MYKDYSIKKRESWYYEFVYKKKRYKKRGFARRTDAEAAERQKRYELQQGISIQESKITVKDYFKEWLSRRHNLSQNTKNLYKTFLNNHLDFFENVQLMMFLLITVNLKVKSKLLCKFPFDRQHGPDDLTYGR
ncbi:hypothetical protein BCV53_07720 [Parageobacillus thermoglucosidasius]|uniref:Core-binding (CB) domain-containing protein n=1 Tax=Parageobacillus thermoglucosidasius TaxID=1426 RepID=A0AAN0YMN6_PARTM|nr:Arm DNA-binding domain-containing protein [Parageobacillus thermoglucosidasius]ALF09896.1 hypothetical protein AOT13_07710 [Parageobacillus thermoglucosidasius]ANZ29977.1 hypothetical protein BCV53_07720 [Parageobacillus thermoglucosidasius]APM80715.1 hypothetical protein BCV54_07725 [Parageobacillus thermoglucosidasius]KJX68987.1 hypothetical protein WH82_10015 [Parageobacillus thermoglucosidasius]